MLGNLTEVLTSEPVVVLVKLFQVSSSLRTSLDMVKSRKRAGACRPAFLTALRLTLFILALMSVFFVADGRESVVRVRTTVRDVYEEVVEDRYNIMDINDPMYDSIDSTEAR